MPYAKLGRTKDQRKALLRQLVTSLFREERIVTTQEKAHEANAYAEKLITTAKANTLHARRLVIREIQDQAVVAKLFDTIAPRYAERPGGYTRILKIGPRRGDGAPMAVLELV